MKNVEMIKHLMSDYENELDAHNGQGKYPSTYNKAKLKRIRLMLNEKMMELESY